MGISYQHKRQRNTLEILRSELSSDCEIVASCIRADCAYLAIKRGDMVIGSVARLYRSRNELGIKWIDEDMGPYYHECPRRVLDCLTPTDSDYAKNWRASCYGWNVRNERLNHDLCSQLFQYNDRKYRIDKKVPKSPGYYVTDMGTGFQYRISRKQLFKAEFVSE
jgi:hypothetical protein